MEQSIKSTLLSSMGEVFDKSKECRLEKSFFEQIDCQLNTLSSYFLVSKQQSFFIAMVFALNYKGSTVDLNDLIEYLDCNPMKILEYTDDFAYLAEAGIFEKKKSGHRVNVATANDQFAINETISEAILQNKPMPDTRLEKQVEDVFEFLEKLYQLGQQRSEGELSTRVLFAKARLLIAVNQHFPLVKQVDGYSFAIDDTILYYYLIWKTLSGKKSTDISVALEGIFDNPVKRINYMQSIQSGNNQLIKNNLIETVEANFFNDLEMKLTDKSVTILKGCGITLHLDKKNEDHIILPAGIPFRELVYNEQEMKQLSLLKNTLKEEQFREMQKRLEERGLPKGVTVLFYGSPGTGKTESVKQLAKETMREIMKVEISRSKSMWFGESEKIIKRIFTDYKAFSKESEQCPILLFNEADAILSKRREIGDSNIAQTENAMQNILLEELENFEGILIATTNLVNNLDSAFDRRFLFKIEFHKPDFEIKTRIWKLKMPYMSDVECKILASEFNFSGGQIDNIVRKKEIYEIVHGEKVTFENLLVFCSEETWVNKNLKIGFNKSPQSNTLPFS